MDAFIASEAEKDIANVEAATKRKSDLEGLDTQIAQKEKQKKYLKATRFK
jgi:hypothetical protein